MTWPLDDLEANDEDHVKVIFEFVIRNSHFWPQTLKEKIDLAMTLKLILSPRSRPFEGWLLIFEIEKI